MLNILIDYDNIALGDSRIATREIDYLIDIIFDGLQKHSLDYKKYRFRLYGGWYINKNMTRKAQNIVAQIQNKYPVVKKIQSEGFAKQVVLEVELAYSIMKKPEKHLFNTYRIRDCNVSFKFNHPIKLGCMKTDCPLLIVSKIINENKCCHNDCNHSLDGMINKGEQKLVDNMISIDMACLSDLDECRDIVLVSSDDDFLPALIFSCIKNKRVLHISSGGMLVGYDLTFLGNRYIAEAIGG